MSDPTWAPARVPDQWSDNRKLAVKLCNLIPAGRWTNYKNLAQAFNSISGGKHNAFTFGRLINDIHLHRGRGVEYWTVPWHRIRTDSGQLAAMGYRGGGVVTDDNERGNVLFNAEANGQGLMHDGIARSSLYVDIHRMIAASGDFQR